MDLKARGLASACKGGRRFRWTVIRVMKLRVQYVGVVALRRGRWERVFALVRGARGGQKDHRARRRSCARFDGGHGAQPRRSGPGTGSRRCSIQWGSVGLVNGASVEQETTLCARRRCLFAGAADKAMFEMCNFQNSLFLHQSSAGFLPVINKRRQVAECAGRSKARAWSKGSQRGNAEKKPLVQVPYTYGSPPARARVGLMQRSCHVCTKAFQPSKVGMLGQIAFLKGLLYCATPGAAIKNTCHHSLSLSLSLSPLSLRLSLSVSLSHTHTHPIGEFWLRDFTTLGRDVPTY